MATGVFFHQDLVGETWPIIGNKFRNFPRVMQEALSLPEVVLFEPKPVPEEILLKMHHPDYLKRVKRDWYYRGAVLSVGGCVEAGERIAKGELTNALVFAVAAGHHCGPSSGWGGTYLSCTGPAVAHLREKFGLRRFAVLDTDSHHGDGTRAIFKGDQDVLHVCFCSYDAVEEDGTKIDINVGFDTNDDAYLEKVWAEFFPRLHWFRPFLIFHNLGHDTCQGDYGDRGLTPEFFPRLAEEVKQEAKEVCEGRYIVITHGGSRADVADYIFPRIISILAQG